MHAVEMSYLRGACGVSRWDGLSNASVYERCGMRLTKRSDNVTKEKNQLGISRRAFMKNSSLVAGGAVVGAGLFAPSMIKKAQAVEADHNAKIEVKRTICSHCSVG